MGEVRIVHEDENQRVVELSSAYTYWYSVPTVEQVLVGLSRSGVGLMKINSMADAAVSPFELSVQEMDRLVEVYQQFRQEMKQREEERDRRYAASSWCYESLDDHPF